METGSALFKFCDEVSSVVGESDSYWAAVKRSQLGRVCRYCGTSCKVESDDLNIGVTGSQVDLFSVCERCGWWSFSTEQESLDGISYHFSAAAILKKFDNSASELPFQVLLNQAYKDPESIHTMSPAKLEELVGAVYSEVLRYRVEFCSYARPDRGIDLIMVRLDSGLVVAVQVKRNKRPIELGQIHQFYGAIVDAGQREGIFVAAGKFRKGAEDTAERLQTSTGLRIDLVDGRRLLEFIEIYGRNFVLPTTDQCPYWKTGGYWANFRQ
jgi:hypothetical protein